MGFFSCLVYESCLRLLHRDMTQDAKVTQDIYTIILHKSVCLSVGVRKLQVAILARSSREMSLTDRILQRYILSRVRVSVWPSNFFIREKH